MPKHSSNGSKDMQTIMVLTGLTHWQMKEETATHKWLWKRKSGMTRNHPALQDGARLQALEARHMDRLLLKWHTMKTTPILHQDKLE